MRRWVVFTVVFTVIEAQWRTCFRISYPNCRAGRSSASAAKWEFGCFSCSGYMQHVGWYSSNRVERGSRPRRAGGMAAGAAQAERVGNRANLTATTPSASGGMSGTQPSLTARATGADTDAAVGRRRRTPSASTTSAPSNIHDTNGMATANPASSPPTKWPYEDGLIEAKVSVKHRPSVTAGLAKEVLLVYQYPAVTHLGGGRWAGHRGRWDRKHSVSGPTGHQPQRHMPAITVQVPRGWLVVGGSGGGGGGGGGWQVLRR